MREHLHAVVRGYFRGALLQFRGARTQATMAELLDMSVRAYVALETGNSCCGLDTFVLFLKMCQDRDAFLDDLFRMMDTANNPSS